MFFITIVVFLFLKAGSFGSFFRFFFVKPTFAEESRVCRSDYAILKSSTYPYNSDDDKNSFSKPFDFSRMIFLFEQVNRILKNDHFEANQLAEREHLHWLKKEFEEEWEVFSRYLSLQKKNKLERSNVRSRKSLLFYRRALINSLSKVKSILTQRVTLKTKPLRVISG